METTPKAMEIEYIRIKRLNQGREKAYATGTNVICYAQRTHSGRGQQEGRRHLRDVLRTRAHLGALRHFRQDRR